MSEPKGMNPKGPPAGAGLGPPWVIPARVAGGLITGAVQALSGKGSGDSKPASSKGAKG